MAHQIVKSQYFSLRVGIEICVFPKKKKHLHKLVMWGTSGDWGD